MENKEIIIDGVDVSGCEWFYKNDPCKNTCKYFCTPCEWVEIQNCMYKYAKRKEQECEKLRFPMKDTNYALLTKEEFEEYKKLKAENEKLDTENKRLVAELANPVFDSFEELDKLKQTLTEIKPILEYYANSTIGEEQEDGTYRIELSYKYGSSNMYGAPCYYKYNPKPARQALQKISECEVE